MVAWQMWLIIAGICFVIEIITVGFLVLWFAIAALIVAFFSIFIHNIVAQTAIFLIISSILIFFTRPLTDKFTKNDNAVTNVKSIIGKKGLVKKEISSKENGQVKVNGDLWSATLEDSSLDSIPEGNFVEVIKVDGVKLVVKPIDTKVKSSIFSK